MIRSRDLSAKSRGTRTPLFAAFFAASLSAFLVVVGSVLVSEPLSAIQSPEAQTSGASSESPDPESPALESPASGTVTAGDPSADGHSAEDETRGSLTTGGSFYVEYRPDPDPIPLNEMFSIHFTVFSGEDREIPLKGAMVTADAWMPEHRHGTSLQPKLSSDGEGGATGVGFLLHMEGYWELRVGVAAQGKMERASFRIDLEP